MHDSAGSSKSPSAALSTQKQQDASEFKSLSTPAGVSDSLSTSSFIQRQQEVFKSQGSSKSTSATNSATNSATIASSVKKEYNVPSKRPVTPSATSSRSQRERKAPSTYAVRQISIDSDSDVDTNLGESSDRALGACSDHNANDFEDLSANVPDFCAEDYSHDEPDETHSGSPNLKTLTMRERFAWTASDLTSGENAILVCPVESCDKEFSPACSIRDFYQSTSDHEAELYQLGLYICEFSCELGFADDLARHIRYRDRSYTVQRNRSRGACTSVI
jgi:hypothetical protein